jgi:hypothetical protein
MKIKNSVNEKIKEYAAGLNQAYNSNFIFNLDDYWLV